MNKTELIEALEDSRQEFIEMLEELPDTLLTEPALAGGWSIKDTLAHLTYWEGQTVTLLFQVLRGVEKPTTVHFGEESVDDINARWHQQSQTRSMEIIWNDFVGVRKQTIRRINEMNESDLTQASRFAWMKGVPLIELVMSDTVEHEEEHADMVREWLDARDARSNGSDRH
jgi:hypothetical protein